MKNVVLVTMVIGSVAYASGLPVLAQRSDNPNLKQFYMARQQIQITDDAPAVNDMRSAPGPAQQSAAAAAAGRSQGLPRAGFMSNMNAYHGGNSGGGLPQVNNGVPAKLPQTANGLPSQPGLKAGNAGKLKAKSPAAPKQPAQQVVKAYKPYATTPVNSGGSGSLLNSSSSVQGSVLHWNRHH